MFGGVFKIKPLSFFFCCSFVTNPGIQVFSAGITKSTHCICNRSYPTDKYIAPLPSVLLNTSMSPFRSLYVSRFLSALPGLIISVSSAAHTTLHMHIYILHLPTHLVIYHHEQDSNEAYTV